MTDDILYYIFVLSLYFPLHTSTSFVFTKEHLSKISPRSFNLQK